MNCVLVKTLVASTNIDAYNRTAKAETDMTNGTPVTLAIESTAGSEVFTATKAGAGVAGVWMVASPEVNREIVGKTYGGSDPRNFTNYAGDTMDVFKLVEGDIVQVTKDFFVANKDPVTVDGATVVELTASGFESKVSATSAYAGISFKILRKEDMVFGVSGVLAEGYDAWLLEVTNN